MWKVYIKEEVNAHPESIGAYQIADSNKNIIYIGEGNIRARLLAHFPDGDDPVVGGSYFDYVVTNDKSKALMLQNKYLGDFKAEHGQLPLFNQKSRN